MLKFKCCEHKRSCKESCVSNKAFLLDPVYLFTHLYLFIEKTQSVGKAGNESGNESELETAQQAMKADVR